MKRVYMRPGLAHVDVEAEGIILTGSDSNQPMKVQNVTVHSYEDGFADPNNPDVMGFHDISFD